MCGEFEGKRVYVSFWTLDCVADGGGPERTGRTGAFGVIFRVRVLLRGLIRDWDMKDITGMDIS